MNNVTGCTEAEVASAQADFEFYTVLAWWLECVAELGIGLTGFLGNCLAIPLLLSKNLASTFNRLLVCLACFDNLFILSCVLEAIRRYIGTTNFHQLAFLYFFYQLQSISLLCSIYTTVVLAIERYLAVTRPVEYHMAAAVANLNNPWKRVWAYMGPTVLFSVIVNIPKFLELEEDYRYEVSETGVNETYIEFKTTDLRMNKNYSFYYVHLFRLTITGILPFCALTYLNYGIYRAIKKLHNNPVGGAGANPETVSISNNNNHNVNNRGSSVDSEDKRCAIVLFVVVIMFLVCNVPRIVLNCYEFFTIDAFKENSDNQGGGCFNLPLWVLVLTSISLVLMTTNSSVNFFIYCLVNPSFRDELKSQWSPAWQCLLNFKSKINFKSSTPNPREARTTSTTIELGTTERERELVPINSAKH